MRLAYLYLLSFNLRVRGIKTLCHSLTRLSSTLINMRIIKQFNLLEPKFRAFSTVFRECDI